MSEHRAGAAPRVGGRVRPVRFPIAIVVISLGFNLLGDGLRDVLDPKQR